MYAIRSYYGIDTTSEVIAFYPRLPPHLHTLHLRLRHRGQWYELNIDVITSYSIHYTKLYDNVYMDLQQAINLAIFRRFEQEQIEFAYPTQTLIIEKGTS